MYFLKVFFLLAILRLSVTSATNSTVVNPTTTKLAPDTTTTQLTPDATTTKLAPDATTTQLTPDATFSQLTPEYSSQIPQANPSISPNAASTASVPSSTPDAGGSSVNTTNAPGGGGGPTTGSNNPFGTMFNKFTFPPTTKTPPPTTVPTTPHPCTMVHRPTDMDTCSNESCALKKLTQMESYIKCGKTGSEDYSKHPTTLPDMGEMLALKISEDIKNKLKTNTPVNDSVVIVTDQLALGASTIDASMYTNISRGVFSFPNMSQEGVRGKVGARALNSIMYPKKDLPLRSDLIQVAWSISETSLTKVPEEEIEPFRDIVWRLPVADMKIQKNKIFVGKEKPHLTINSPVITFSMVPKPSMSLENPLKIAFRLLKNKDVRDHRCYFWSANSPPSSGGFWSSIGSSVVLVNETHIVCSYTHMSTYVVLSEIHPEADDTARKIVRIVAIVFCILAMAALIATIRLTRKLNCFDNDRVNIHVHLCVVLFIGYLLFIIGAIKSDIAVLNDILAIALHFCQFSPFVWLFLEAVYFLNVVFPLFNYENTNTQKFYVSLGWALTAAFAGATAGFDMPHHGKPHASEIIWVFISKSTLGYFFGPLLALFLINLLIRVGLVIHVTFRAPNYDGDKVPLRIKVNLLTTFVLSTVVLLAWCMGIRAVNNTETKGYHYGFLLLYCFQAFLVFVIYGWQNEEMWSLHNKRKEEERLVEERKITFTYVP
ncbi:adhesion G protein-coupled receptor L1-like [Dendronephthya gigantea]|uniref:adhesion G protein-coupled receptor L1-like n=1 Tax=Dendronephthya gigantea TaxID=151771 RepID=UPI00106BB3B6|nr:adhesion G protein-coupled receptor L1-like [Dendronephthya gigantea]